MAKLEEINKIPLVPHQVMFFKSIYNVYFSAQRYKILAMHKKSHVCKASSTIHSKTELLKSLSNTRQVTQNCSFLCYKTIFRLCLKVVVSSGILWKKFIIWRCTELSIPWKVFQIVLIHANTLEVYRTPAIVRITVFQQWTKGLHFLYKVKKNVSFCSWKSYLSILLSKKFLLDLPGFWGSTSFVLEKYFVIISLKKMFL